MCFACEMQDEEMQLMRRYLDYVRRKKAEEAQARAAEPAPDVKTPEPEPQS